MKKRILASVMAMVMILSLAACGNSSPATTTAAETTQASTTKAAETTQAATTEEEKNYPSSWLCEEKTTLTVFTNEGANNSYPVASNDLPFWQWLEDYTNVHIEWEIGPTASYDEVIQTKLAAGVDMPDIIMTNTAENANNAGENGILADLSEYWDTCFTNTSAYFAADGTDYLATVAAPDGSLYAICGPVAPIEGHILIMYNTEWLAKLGASVPKTLDEFTDLVYKMQAAGDLNGNGEADEIVLTGAGSDYMTNGLGSAFGIEQYEGWDAFVADENGVVTDEYTSENMKTFLTYIQKLYTDGIIDSEITTMKANKVSEKVAQDRVGIFIYYSAFAITYGSLTSAGQAEPLSEQYTLGWPLASEYNNNDAYYTRRDKISSSPTAVTSDCENKELACKWLDTLFADPEVLLVRTYGFEGEDWQYDANGNIELIYPADGSAWNIVSKGCGQIPLCFIQTKAQLLNSKLQYEWYIAEYDELREGVNWKAPSLPRVNAYSADEKAVVDEVKTDVTSYWKEMRDKFMTGAADIDKDWDTFVNTMNSLGLKEWTGVWQSIYDRTYGA